eukprot:1153232-Pyramimonas_sp.AAC.1
MSCALGMDTASRDRRLITLGFGCVGVGSSPAAGIRQDQITHAPQVTDVCVLAFFDFWCQRWAEIPRGLHGGP